jgi:hypothetical protein
MAAFDIGLMGSDTHFTTSYRLAGWCVYGLRVLVPILSLVAIRVGEALESRVVGGAGLVVLAGSAVGDFLVTTSKGALLFALARYVVLMIVLGRFTAGRVRTAVAVGAAVALSFPLLNAVRYERLEGSDAASAIQRARHESGDAREDLVALARPAVMRISGIGAMLPLVHEGRVLPELALAGFVGGPSIGLYTTRLYGYGSNEGTSFAPGLLGWMYVACGPDWMPLGLCAFLLVLELIWRILYGLRLWTRPEAVTMVTLFAVALLNDGVIEKATFSALAIVASVCATEVVARSSRAFRNAGALA